MKNAFQKPVLKITLFSLLTLVTVIFSCKKNDSADNALSGKDHSAEELYRNLIFLKGDIVSAIPELTDMSDELTKTGSKYSAQDLSRINDVVAGMKKYYPSFLESFKTAVTSKDPLKVENAMVEASNKTINVIFLDKFSSKVPEEMRSKFYGTVISHSDEINKLVLERSTNKLSNSELQQKVASLFGFENTVNSDIASSLGSQNNQLKAQVGESEAALAVLVNVVFLINVYAGVNIEFEVNVHQIVNFHTYENVKVEFSSVKVNDLTKEQLYASIASSL